MASSPAPTRAVDVELKRYQELQDELTQFSQVRNQLYQQANENGMVKQELELLKPGTKVFKMITPVLLKQDLDEAKVNVAKRIEFIQGEMAKVEKQIEAKTKEQAEIGDNIAKMQGEMQARAAEEARKAVEASKG
ncbi:Prefoldin [Tribonema minus]|uniref:Prefoldin n=1 Tax=Tribonema minus TaxID=303371 RepID=A0A835ZF83_9STRA|nr:Prefoldin [Tribonema minus]|eukprot:TRINITY_DN4977_c0_g1_i1.p2 TRINITY_DN4977_c0_g1~~TRINITY_DN4977_c0_g1_i1.p2  ORF type:complete len:149 (-),score=26.10 TRINITY_DN4977_c0_g1_i1:53-457(-)